MFSLSAGRELPPALLLLLPARRAQGATSDGLGATRATAPSSRGNLPEQGPTRSSVVGELSGTAADPLAGARAPLGG